MRFKVGSTVVEDGSGLVGIVIGARQTAFLVDPTRSRYHPGFEFESDWDYAIFYENSEVAYADDEDLKVCEQIIEESKNEI
jgi:hypothetical protein